MKVRDKHSELEELIRDLSRSKNPFWKSVAKALNRSRRIRFEVNLYRIERYAKSNDNIIVPGVVLGTGEIKKPVNVAAIRFSKSAKEKIERAGGKCFGIKELLEKNIENIKIMG